MFLDYVIDNTASSYSVLVCMYIYVCIHGSDQFVRVLCQNVVPSPELRQCRILSWVSGISELIYIHTYSKILK